MQKLTTLTLIAMLVIISCAVIFGQPKQEYFIMVATGYCPCELCCHPWDNGLTYTGDIAGRGCVAIDPEARILRMGQRVWIEGYGHGKCNDVGSAIQGWRIDLCFSTHQEALEWGRRLVKVYVVED